jgi:hypothetical protein
LLIQTLEEHTFTFLKPPGQRVSFAEVECRARFFDPDPTVAGEPHYSLDTTYLSGVKENEEDYLDDLGDLVEDESEYGAMDAKMTMEQDQELAQDESVIPCTQQHHVLLPAASWSWTATAPTFLPPKSSFFIDMAATTTADESKIVDGVATQEIMTENTIMPNKIQQNGIILTENDSELLPLCMKKDQEEGQLLVTVTDKEKRIMVVEHSVVNSDTRVEIEAKNTSSSSSTSGCEDTVITMSGRETALQSSAEEGSSSASPTTTYPSWDGCSSSSTEAETEDDEVSSDCGLHDFVFPEVFVSPYTSSSLPINEELETDRDETPAAVEKLIRKDERKEFKCMLFNIKKKILKLYFKRS